MKSPYCTPRLTVLDRSATLHAAPDVLAILYGRFAHELGERNANALHLAGAGVDEER